MLFALIKISIEYYAACTEYCNCKFSSAVPAFAGSLAGLLR